MKWWEKWSGLSVGAALVIASAVALAQERNDGFAAFAAAGFVVLGVWLAAELHDRWKDDDHDKD